MNVNYTAYGPGRQALPDRPFFNGSRPLAMEKMRLFLRNGMPLLENSGPFQGLVDDSGPGGIALGAEVESVFFKPFRSGRFTAIG